jgi:hypothetical protein
MQIAICKKKHFILQIIERRLEIEDLERRISGWDEISTERCLQK